MDWLLRSPRTTGSERAAVEIALCAEAIEIIEIPIVSAPTMANARFFSTLVASHSIDSN